MITPRLSSRRAVFAASAFCLAATSAEQGRRADAKTTRRLRMRGRQRRLDLLELAEDGPGAVIEEPPVVGQRQPARRPVQQPRAEMPLERGDLTADRGQ